MQAERSAKINGITRYRKGGKQKRFGEGAKGREKKDKNKKEQQQQK